MAHRCQKPSLGVVAEVNALGPNLLGRFASTEYDL